MQPRTPAPSPAGALPHIEVEASPDDGRFVLAFVSALLTAWALLIVLAVAVDPLADYGTGLVTPLVPNDRDIKAAAYDAISPAPQALVLGSSRVMMLPPACLSQAVGMPAFNFGLNSARAEDYFAVLRFAQSRGPVRRLLVGVDPEALHNVVPPDDRLLHSRSLAPFLAPGLRPALPARLYTAASSALSWESVAGSLRALKFALIGGRPPASYTFDARGLIHQPERDAAWRARAIGTSTEEYLARHYGFTALSESRTAALRSFLEAARAGGAQVDVFIPPLHPALIAGMQASTLERRTHDVEVLLAGFEREGLVRFVRVPTLESFGGDPALFDDGAHMTSANGVRLLATIYPGTTCAVQ